MNRKTLFLALAFTPLCALVASGANANPQDAASGDNTLGCEMSFTLSGWSIIYHAANGHGTVTCDNGRSMDVNLSATGAGLTVGKYKLEDGHAEFTGVTDISDVLGTYGVALAHAGAVESSRAVAMTKGAVSLTMTGTGSGWDIGAGLAGFTISRAK